MQQMKIPIQINAPRFLMKKNTSLQLKSTQHPDIQISTELPVAKQSRPPHSKTCGHPKKGHQTIHTGRKCLQCPNQQCLSVSKDTKCLCEWHQKSSSQPKPAKDHYKTENIKYNTTTEFILPNELCQLSLSPNGVISNACTIITVLTGLRFLQEDLHTPSVEDDNSVQPFFKQYREIMIEGNTLYSIINPPSHNPNLLVQDVIRSIDFSLVETPFVAVNNHTSVAAELQKAHQEVENKKANVLIVPPDKSMAIIQDKQRIFLLDSHSHREWGNNNGGKC